MPVDAARWEREDGDVQPEGDRPQQDPHRRRLIAAAGRALAAARAGDDNSAVEGVLRLLIDPSEAPAGHRTARELVLLLFSECSEMVSSLGSGQSTAVKMQVFDDDGQELSIDEADPPVRTAVRTLLAEVNGDDDAAGEQVEIALSSGAPQEMASLVQQALRWTIRLSDECAARGIPTSEWIASALDL